MKLATIALSLVAGSICVSAQVNDNSVRYVRLIDHVKQMPVTELDEILPSVSFETWLQDEAGPEAKISFVERRQTGNSSDRRGALPTCVEADVQMKDGRSIVILIAVEMRKNDTGPKPKLFSAQIFAHHEAIDVSRLSELPAALIRTQD